MDKPTETFIHTMHHILGSCRGEVMSHFLYAATHLACHLIMVRSFAFKVLGSQIFLNKLAYSKFLFYQQMHLLLDI